MMADDSAAYRLDYCVSHYFTCLSYFQDFYFIFIIHVCPCFSYLGPQHLPANVKYWHTSLPRGHKYGGGCVKALREKTPPESKLLPTWWVQSTNWSLGEKNWIKITSKVSNTFYGNIRTLDMPFTASSWVANSTSASPDARPLLSYRRRIFIGTTGRKNWRGKWKH